RSPNFQEFLYSILFLLLVAGYLIRTHLLFVSRAYIALEQLGDSLEDIRGSTLAATCYRVVVPLMGSNQYVLRRNI
ncbi:hypothetical protein Goklo_004725, partial [Gossypium klotzschianum]|nr:hypothetical protein [Gossypium klotzschianum]